MLDEEVNLPVQSVHGPELGRPGFNHTQSNRAVGADKLGEDDAGFAGYVDAVTRAYAGLTVY